MRKIRCVLTAALVVGVISATACVLRAQDVPAAPKAGVRRFNFAPGKAPDVPGFVKITGKSHYDKKPGHGWLEVKG